MKKIFALLLAFAAMAPLRAQQKAGSPSVDKPPKGKVFPADKDTVFSRHSTVPVMALPPRKLVYFHTLGLVWGFLKYYHPAIAEGRYNWDNELFRFLPQYIAAVEDTPGRNAILYAWVRGLGPFETTPPTRMKKAKSISNLGWIDSAGFSPQLRDLLWQVKNAKRPKESYYAVLERGAENAIFRNERVYENIRFPDAGMQLLALYRYWNAAQYFFLPKNLMGQAWKGVLAEMIPFFVQAQSDTAYTAAAQELIDRLHDTHASSFTTAAIPSCRSLPYVAALRFLSLRNPTTLKCRSQPAGKTKTAVQSQQ